MPHKFGPDLIPNGGDIFDQMFLQSSNHFDHLCPKKKLLVICCFLPQALPGVSPPFDSVIIRKYLDVHLILFFNL